MIKLRWGHFTWGRSVHAASGTQTDLADNIEKITTLVAHGEWRVREFPLYCLACKCGAGLVQRHGSRNICTGERRPVHGLTWVKK